MYVKYEIFEKFRDDDNYSDERFVELDLIGGCDLEEIYDGIIKICLKYHENNLRGKSLDKLSKIEINDCMDFGYCSSYDNDYYLTFGDIVLGSLPISTDEIKQRSEISLKCLLENFNQEKLKVKQTEEENKKLERKKLYEQLKSEFGEE